MRRMLCKDSEAGQSLVLVIVFLLLGALTIVPTLSFLSTALDTGTVYEDKADSIFAADAGIEDAIWQIKYDALEILYDDPNYAYDFATACDYQLDSPVNDLAVTVTIQNVWIPSNTTMGELGLTPALAHGIIERDITDSNINRLIVTGTALDEDDYRIKLDFYPAEEEEDPLEVTSLGIWLPHGFTYDGGCNLATFEDTAGLYAEDVSARPGGQAVVWDFGASPLLFTDLPPEGLYPDSFPQTAEITFKYLSEQPEARPAAIAWMVAAGPVATDIPAVWDIDTRMYKITAAAGDTAIEAYASRCQLRNMYAATAGDYVAIGNSLMTDDYPDIWDIRDTPHATSSYTVANIPDDATVTHAYLYWSGFFDSGFSSPQYWGPDTCKNFNNWDGPNRYWRVASQQFRGEKTYYGSDTRYLEMEGSVDLSGCPAGQTILEWEQSESWLDNLESTGFYADRLKFRISGDNGISWSDYETAFAGDLGLGGEYYYYIIPEDYLTDQFKMKFYLDGFNESGEYCAIDNIAVARIIGAADTAAGFNINGYDIHTETINALQSQVLGTKVVGQYSYACWQDVTALVREHCVRGDDDNPTGNGQYTVGGTGPPDSVEADDDELLSYAGWSLIIIYHSQETAGRQLYLWNTFSYCRGSGDNLDFDSDGEPGGHIRGFIIPEQIGDDPVAAKLTCFVGEGDECWLPDTLAVNGVELWDGTTSDSNYEGYPHNVWNAESLDMQNGIDIDTFTIGWDILHADDTEAQIDLVSDNDNFNLIYLVLSVRSETVIGGTRHYTISRN